MESKHPTPAERREPSKPAPAAKPRAAAPAPKHPLKRELLHKFEFEVGNRARSHFWASFSVWAPTPDAAVKRARELKLWIPHDFSETDSGINRRMVDSVLLVLDPRRLTVDQITGIEDGAGFGMFDIRRGELRPGMTPAEFTEFLLPRRREVGVANGVQISGEDIPAYVRDLEQHAAASAPQAAKQS